MQLGLKIPSYKLMETRSIIACLSHYAGYASNGSDFSHIYVTFSNTGENEIGLPFAPFVNHYSGPNLYLFPGESLTTDDFALDPSVHGFTIEADPNRAFLAIYDYNDAESVTIT